jgi:hypothetical protein
LDDGSNQLIVGYGSGGLGVIDIASSRTVAKVSMSVHPEGFRLNATSNQLFVNLRMGLTVLYLI